MTNSREIQLVKRPNGVPTLADFALVQSHALDAGEGEIQVRNLIMSVDPYMRPQLTADQPLNAPLLGGGIGRVIQSRNQKFGDVIFDKPKGYGWWLWGLTTLEPPSNP